MSGHTPGPWKVDGVTEQSTCCCASEKRVSVVAGKKNGEIVQVLGETWDEKLSKDGCTPEAHANAHLIAAAPELLDALKALVRAGGIWPDLSERVAAAIAKAEGK